MQISTLSHRRCLPSPHRHPLACLSCTLTVNISRLHPRLALTLARSLGGQLIHWGDRSVVTPLVAAGYRVIRMDNRDAGLSTYLRHLKPENMIRRRLRAMANAFGNVRFVLFLLSPSMSSLQ